VPLRPEQLPNALASSLAPVYLLAGVEPLLLQECRDQVIEAAQQQGFTERSVHEAGARYDWNLLSEDSGAMSLFASRRIIDIRLPTGKPGQEGAPVNGRFERSYRYTVVDTIGGGTSEVQKNIIARRGLGLPANF